MTLLSVNADAKTSKGQVYGYLTGILYLAPHTLGGKPSICPFASPGCIKACLNTAGRGVFSSTQQARIRRTKAWRADPTDFVRRLAVEIRALEKRAKRMGLKPAVRLNGTSDIAWELTPIIRLFPGVQFYDYTKDPSRMFADLPANYHLTFSRSEKNDADVLPLLRAYKQVAVVFAGKTLPTLYRGYRVIDGDRHDARFLDLCNVVIGLRAKGKAKHDTTGFVVRT